MSMPLSPVGNKLELISELALQNLLARLTKISDDNDAVLSELFKETTVDFTSNDLSKIVETTTSIKTKIAMIEMIAPKLIDPVEKKGHFLNLFKFSEDKEKVEKALKGRLGTIQNSVFLNRNNSARLNIVARGGGRGSFRNTAKTVINQNRVAKSADAVETNQDKSINISKAATMDDNDVQLEKLVITSRKIQHESIGRSDYKKLNSPSETLAGNPLHAQQVAFKAKEIIKTKQSDVLNNSRAFTAEKIDGIKLDTTQLGQRRYSSIKDVVAMFNKTKKMMSVEDQYGISKEEQEKEQKELEEKLAKQKELNNNRHQSQRNSITVSQDGEGVNNEIMITLDNDDDDDRDDDEIAEEARKNRKGLFGDDDEDDNGANDNDDDDDDDFFANLRKGQSQKLATNKKDSFDGDTDAQADADAVADADTNGNSSEQALEGLTSPTPQQEINVNTSTSPSVSSRVQPEPNKDLAGFLLKKSPSIWMGWQIRWFKFLDNGDLIYYKKEDSIKAQGTIKLKDILPKRKILVDRQHRFDLHTRNRVYHIMATSSEDALAWASELTKRVKRLNNHF